MNNPLQQIKRLSENIRRVNSKVKLLLHIEDAWFLNEDNIQELIDCKPFSVGLTWNEKNNLAGGCSSSGTLTQLGKKVIEKLTENRILIDAAHLNKQSFAKVTEVLNGKKFFCSHTCFDAVNTHPRNLDDWQIRKIIESGGVIGLTLVSEFLVKKDAKKHQKSVKKCSKKAALDDVFAHLRHFFATFSEENIAFGTDFFGTCDLPKGLKRYKNFKKLANFLISKGIKNETIEKVFHANARNFINSLNDF